MFARQVTMSLKPYNHDKFTETIEKEVLPVLRKQQGFQDEITFVNQGGVKAVAISLWDRKENAEAYDRAAYPQVLKSLAGIIEGTPQVENCNVSNSTWHKISALQA